jgi:hypothetical protein
MDPQIQGTIAGVSIPAMIAIAYGFYKCINHHRLVSRCCGRRFDVSLDIDLTPKAGGPAQTLTPPGAKAPLIQNEAHGFQATGAPRVMPTINLEGIE